MPKTSKELKRCLDGMLAYYARWIRNFSVKIKPLTAGKIHFPLKGDAVAAFKNLREELLSACLKCADENEPFTTECDASAFAIAAVLSQGEPVAYAGNFHGEVWFRVIWWSFAFSVRCL